MVTSAAELGAVLPARLTRRGSMALVAVAFTAALLQACSGGEPRKEEPAVWLTSSAPANGALAVAPSSQVTLTFSGALDASTVSASTVSLRCVDTYTVDGYSYQPVFSPPAPAVVAVSVSWDAASRTITVAPATALAVKRNCVLDTAGLRDTFGRPVTASVSFRTAANPPTRRVRFGNGGDASSWDSVEHDASGNVIREVRRWSPGADGEWLTGDDDVDGGWVHAYDAAGNWTRGFYSFGPGSDLTWFTGDDVASEISAAKLDAQGRLLWRDHFYDAGLDGVSFTGDEQLMRWTDVVLNAAGDVVAESLHNPPRRDGATHDEFVVFYRAFAYDAPGGRLLRFSSFPDMGPDGVAFTADDFLEESRSYGYDAAGLHRTTLVRLGPGTDRVWFTADDYIASCERVSYDDRRQPIRFVLYRGGADGICLTPDDDVVSYRQLTYAANGARDMEFTYAAVGPDGEWFTADDVPEQMIWFDPSL